MARWGVWARTYTVAAGALLAPMSLMVLLAVTAVLLPAQPARAQEADGAPPGRGAFAGMQRVTGEVTANAGGLLTVKTEDGTYKVVTTENTRVMKGRGVTVKAAELQVGDGVMAAGNLEQANKTLHAAMIFATDAAQVKALRENLGKTYIAGRVTAIDLDNAKLTVERPDHVSQTIGLDESTSFRRGRLGGGGRGYAPGGATPDLQAAPGGQGGTPGAGGQGGESITLADIKVGDQVGGQGSLKNGVFVPAQLSVAPQGQGRRREGAGARPGGSPASGPAALSAPVSAPTSAAGPGR